MGASTIRQSAYQEGARSVIKRPNETSDNFLGVCFIGEAKPHKGGIIGGFHKTYKSQHHLAHDYETKQPETKRNDRSRRSPEEGRFIHWHRNEGGVQEEHWRSAVSSGMSGATSKW